jgi:cytochrome c553
MTAQAALLAEEDLPKLAAYFASLEGLETTKPE